MKKLIIPFIAALFCMIVSLLVGCKNPQKMLVDGDYEKAYYVSMEKLIKNNDDETYREILLGAMQKIIELETVEINASLNSGLMSGKKRGLLLNQKLQERIEKTKPYVGRVFLDELDRLKEEEKMTKGNFAQYYFDLDLNRF